jgi:hypothetical protein
MECLKCKVPNDKGRKFCRMCGAPLGMYCERCGTVNHMEDKFCGTCGMALISLAGDDVLSGRVEQNIPRQYKAREIDEMLTLRKKVEKEKEDVQTFSQNDIDQLFD